jgi:putative nucleotidyltransferase with HDIG domain
MSRNSLSFESTRDTQHRVSLSLYIAQFQGLQGYFSRTLRVEEYSSFAQIQRASKTMASLEYAHLQEEPLFYELKQEFSEVLARLTPILKAKDRELYRHSLRVHSLASSLTSVLNLSEEDALTIGLAAFFHDIGKTAINNTVLHKPSRLTRQEFEVVKGHTAYGAKILSQFKMLKNVVPSVYYHHECWDGRGYPDGIRGNAIPLGARVVAIVDAFDAMTSDRNYRERRTASEALEELRRCAGTQFDAQLASFFCNSLEKTILGPTLVDSTNAQ